MLDSSDFAHHLEEILFRHRIIAKVKSTLKTSRVEVSERTLEPLGVEPDGVIAYAAHYDVSAILDRPVEHINCTIKLN